LIANNTLFFYLVKNKFNNFTATKLPPLKP
jgi:hypothetical protein